VDRGVILRLFILEINNLKHNLMKKYFYNKALIISLLLLGFYSCDTVDEVELARKAKPEVNLVQASVNVSENGTASVSIEADKASTSDMIFKLVQIDGTAERNVDYRFAEESAPDYGSIGGRIVIPAYSTIGSTTIIGLTDFEVDNKSAKFELRPMESMEGVVGGSKILSLSIDDYIEDDLTVVLSWEVNVDTEDACDQDLDLYLFDSSNTEVSHSWFDCPEQVVLPASAPDGDYFVHIDYYAPNTVAVDPAVDPLYNTRYILTTGQVGVSSQSFSNSFSDSDTTNHYLNWTAYAQFGGDGLHLNVIQITKSGTNYTVIEL
jgi:hypothetical protein